MKPWNLATNLLCLSLLAILNTATLQAQQDPGPRGAPAGAVGPFPFAGLNNDEKKFFEDALMRFQEVNSVSGVPEAGNGLGPTFNGNSCAMCHVQPVIGGSSPAINPQVALATLDGARNTIPSFITEHGPIREARFIRNRDGSLDGGVHGLFTIRGRTDAPNCNLAQPNFAEQLAHNNVSFRIPTPLFGLGLVENTSDATLRLNLDATYDARRKLGIGGRFNTSGNDGTITRFGWKAQNKSLLVFAGEAYNVEQGVTNENFPNERSGVPGCVFNATPEDSSNIVTQQNKSTIGTVSEMLADFENFAAFMRLLAPPTPGAMSGSAINGSKLFSQVGCDLCHSPSLTTADSVFTGMGGVTYKPFSDFALHHMGRLLADGINQGAAGPDQFRTAPLWGVGQRLFFLHDGRTSDLLKAIQAHADDCAGRIDGDGHGDGHGDRDHCSEADSVINKFNSLSKAQIQDILIFLRSL
jgi:CxxC motif-containing protein (DUF1111 family)